MGPRRTVTDLECARQWPIVIDSAAGGNDSAKCVLQTLAIAGSDADLHIGHQAEERAAPVGAAPGVRVVQAFVARLRFTFPHAVEHVAPDLFCGKLAGLHTRDGLDVSGQPFFHPVLVVRQRREG